MTVAAIKLLEEIKALPPREFEAVWQQLNRLAAEMEKPAMPPGRVSDEEFETALDEVTGCTAGGRVLQQLLEDRRGERERDATRLEASKRERARG